MLAALDHADVLVMPTMGTAAPKIEPDPVIEAYKKDVDRTLLRQNLLRSPEERWANLIAATRLADELRREGATSRGR